jgi:hypothetical protein
MPENRQVKKTAQYRLAVGRADRLGAQDVPQRAGIGGWCGTGMNPKPDIVHDALLGALSGVWLCARP